MNAPASELIDHATLQELRDTAGAEFVGDLIDTFLDEAPQMLAQLRAAHAAGDAQAFRRAAHSLKSNSLTFGAQSLAAAARALELQGLDADPAPDAAALDALQAVYAAAAAALAELRHA